MTWARLKIKCEAEELLPYRAKEGDAGLDLKSAESFTCASGQIDKVKTGIRVEIPHGYYGLILGRSGLSLDGFHVMPGVIDSGYRGEISVMFNAVSPAPIQIKRGQRIAQILIVPFVTAEIDVVTELSESERGACGFGSSGVE